MLVPLILTLALLQGLTADHGASEREAGRAADLVDEGRRLATAKKYPEAVAKFRQALQLSAGQVDALIGLGRALYAIGDVESGRTYLFKAAESNAPEAWRGLAEIYLVRVQNGQAKRWAEKLVAVRPGDANARKLLDAATKGNLEPAFRAEIEPAGHSKDTREGWLAFSQGDFRRAISAFQRRLKKEARDAAAHIGVGYALMSNTQVDTAQEHFRKALEIWPEAAGAMNGLATCLRSKNRRREAIEIWQKIDRSYPSPNAGTVGLARVYLELREYAKAKEQLELLVRAFPGDRAYRTYLEHVREKLSRTRRN